ncbi:MAG: helix-turn-helix transcriptional regulator [Caulobacteraceae bacterium]
MADTSWQDLEIWDRVKWARSRRFRSATEAAGALGMKEGTYRCYERGPGSAKFIALDYRHAQMFARLFKVRWEWLLDGVGRPLLTEEDESEAEEDERPANYIRAWREYRGLNVAELAKKSELGVQTINALESGEMDTSGKLLNRIADALDTTRGHLLDVDPDNVDPEALETFEAIPKERRGQALEILKTFRRYNRLR